MALIKCPECGREISNAATSCPHCGYPLGEVTATVDAVMDDATHADVNDTSVASPPPRKRKSGPIIAIAVVAVLAVSFGFFFSQQRKTAARKEYIANLITASDLMYSGGVSAETAYNRVHDVWYNTIFKKSDMYTNKYTIKPSKYKESILTFYNDKDFNDDFNTSLDALFSSEEYKSTVASLNNNKNQVSD